MDRGLAGWVGDGDLVSLVEAGGGDGSGLHLLVKESGARSWVYRFMLKGKARDVGLGPAAGPDAISLSDARDAAAALRLKVKAGIDPLAERHREATAALAAAQAAADSRNYLQGCR